MISVIIPTFNEDDNIGRLIQQLKYRDKGNYIREIIVSDGGSMDDTVSIAEGLGARTYIAPKKGRASQMNFGASKASGEILYFLHADTIPPESFSSHIIAAYHSGKKSGCYRLKFDSPHLFLKLNSWFTRFNLNAIRFGDQSLFTGKEIFSNIKGFREDLTFMEDQEIIPRIRKHSRFIVLPDYVVTSARKYRDNGAYRTQGIFFIIYLLYYLGCSQESLVKLFRKLIKQNKI